MEDFGAVRGQVQERKIGPRKYKLLELINLELASLAKKGIDGMAYIKRKYKFKTKEFYKEITTKELTGLISDLKELKRS